jgi:hypothetical protein
VLKMIFAVGALVLLAGAFVTVFIFVERVAISVADIGAA